MHTDWMIASPRRVRLANYAPSDNGGLDQDTAQREIHTLPSRLAERQELL